MNALGGGNGDRDRPGADRSDRERLRFRVNGTPVELLVSHHRTLLEVLREDLDLTGTKHGCELGECGACTVLLDGKPVPSCLRLAVACQGSEVTTVEGLADGPDPHPLQRAFVEMGAVQCGYCTPGMLLTAKALLDETRDPGIETIRTALSGNLCRCTGYLKITEAVARVAETEKNR